MRALRFGYTVYLSGQGGDMMTSCLGCRAGRGWCSLVVLPRLTEVWHTLECANKNGVPLSAGMTQPSQHPNQNVVSSTRDNCHD